MTPTKTINEWYDYINNNKDFFNTFISDVEKVNNNNMKLIDLFTKYTYNNINFNINYFINDYLIYAKEEESFIRIPDRNIINAFIDKLRNYTDSSLFNNVKKIISNINSAPSSPSSAPSAPSAPSSAHSAPSSAPPSNTSSTPPSTSTSNTSSTPPSTSTSNTSSASTSSTPSSATFDTPLKDDELKNYNVIDEYNKSTTNLIWLNINKQSIMKLLYDIDISNYNILYYIKSAQNLDKELMDKVVIGNDQTILTTYFKMIKLISTEMPEILVKYFNVPQDITLDLLKETVSNSYAINFMRAVNALVNKESAINIIGKYIDNMNSEANKATDSKIYVKDINKIKENKKIIIDNDTKEGLLNNVNNRINTIIAEKISFIELLLTLLQQVKLNIYYKMLEIQEKQFEIKTDIDFNILDNYTVIQIPDWFDEIRVDLMKEPINIVIENNVDSYLAK